jgi:hypothetical protein
MIFKNSQSLPLIFTPKALQICWTKKIKIDFFSLLFFLSYEVAIIYHLLFLIALFKTPVYLKNHRLITKLMPLINRHILTAFSRILKQKTLTLVH